ncbi:MAG: pyridoxine 5'-phosphate synthase [Akkermansia muciniphila]
MLLGVNIDHIATLRQARYATMLDSFNVEPSVLDAAYAAQRGGRDSITSMSGRPPPHAGCGCPERPGGVALP